MPGHGPEENLPRITSYNVCYTKLLRAEMNDRPFPDDRHDGVGNRDEPSKPRIVLLYAPGVPAVPEVRTTEELPWCHAQDGRFGRRDAIEKSLRKDGPPISGIILTIPQGVLTRNNFV